MIGAIITDIPKALGSCIVTELGLEKNSRCIFSTWAMGAQDSHATVDSHQVFARPLQAVAEL